MINKTSFGEYFDKQRDRLEKAMQNKNTQLNTEWREDYDKRQREKKERRYRKELLECSEKGVEISQECKTFYKKKFECRMFVPIEDNYYKRLKKNDETKENSERS